MDGASISHGVRHMETERRAIAQLQVGEQVTGITSTVVTYQPGLIRIDGDLPDRDLQRGDNVSPTPIGAKVFLRFGSRASIIPSSTSRSRNVRIAQAAACTLRGHLHGPGQEVVVGRGQADFRSDGMGGNGPRSNADQPVLGRPSLRFYGLLRLDQSGLAIGCRRNC